MHYFKCYEMIVIKYFEQVAISNIPKRPISEKIIYVGLNTINHVFSIYLEKMRNLDITLFYCDKAIQYYLEYIEQISNLHIKHDLNYNDAVIFVYSKTLAINPIQDDLNDNTSLISSLQNEYTSAFPSSNSQKYKDIASECDLRPILHNIAKITNCLLNWNALISLSERIDIVKNHLHKFLHVFSELNNIHYIQAIEYVHEKICLKNRYQEWLNELYRIIKRNKRPITEGDINEKILRWNSLDCPFSSQYESVSLREFAKLVIHLP
jgi:hypothetical protein